MPWQELTLRVAKQQSVDIEDLLERLGAIAITLRDADGSPLFEPAPGETPLWNVVSITALFEEGADVQMVLAQLPEGVHGQTSHLADRVWEREWLENFKPMREDAARFFLTGVECSWMASLPGAHRSAELLRLWTVKEALFKADLCNAGRTLRDYRVHDPRAVAGRARTPDFALQRYTSRRLNGGVLTVAITGGE